MVKPFQFLSNFTNHPLFISLIGCQSRKPQTKAGRKRVLGNSPPRGLRRGLGRKASRAGAQTRTLARLKPKIGDFLPNTPNPSIFHQNQVYTTSLHFQLHPITSNYTLNFKIGDQFVTFNPMIQLTLICIN